MATLKQIEANRLNAQKSTGPRTRKGKAVSRLNALRHGLRANPAILPPARFQQLLHTRDLFLQHQPPESLQQLRATAERACSAWKARHWRDVLDEIVQRPSASKIPPPVPRGGSLSA